MSDTTSRVCVHGSLRRQCEVCDLTEQRDAALAEHNEWRNRAMATEAELIQRCDAAIAERDAAVVQAKRLITASKERSIASKNANASHAQSLSNWMVRAHEAEAALTEARRVLREVLPVDCEHVLHPKRDQHPFGAACPVLRRAAAVLAQEEK